jgi:hypothetical protein
MYLHIIKVLLVALILSAKKVDEKNKFLNYENYSQSNSSMPYDLRSQQKFKLNDSVLVYVGTLFNYNNEFQIKNDMFNWLIRQDVINGLNQMNYFNRNYHRYKDSQEYIEAQKQELKLYYLGRLKLSNKFESHLILSAKELSNDIFTAIYKKVFLINTKRTRVLSITEVSSYSSFEGHINHRYTKFSSDGSFNVFDKVLSTDTIILDEEGEENLDVYDEQWWVKFWFDNKGYIVRVQE